MLDIELVDELDDASRKVAGTKRLPAEAAAVYVQDLAKVFIADPSSLHWWESLKGSATRVSYGNADSLAKLESLLGDQADARLVVTDEEEPPWPVYAGSALQLIAMLRECRFCEYMMAAHDMSWVIFDTHMNELVSVGSRATSGTTRIGTIIHTIARAHLGSTCRMAVCHQSSEANKWLPLCCSSVSLTSPNRRCFWLAMDSRSNGLLTRSIPIMRSTLPKCRTM